MGWIAPSVLSDTMPPWDFYLTCQGQFLWHHHISSQVATHPAETDGTMPHVLYFSTGGKNLCTTVASPRHHSVSLYMLCGNLLYHNWWSLVLNCIDKEWCNIKLTPCYVVKQIIYSAFLNEIPHFLARTKWSRPDTFLVLTWATYTDKVLLKLSNTVA